MTNYTTSSVLILLLYLVSPAFADNSISPLSVLQGLHIVQDSFTRGEIDNLSIQNELLDELKVALENFARDSGVTAEWEQGAIGYALSGAPSDLAYELLEKVGIDSPLKPLAMAIGSYLKADLTNAAKQFEAINLTELPANLAPLVIIAHATAEFEINPIKSQELFQVALNLAPGTLIEELSLRRITQISMETGDKAEFLRATKAYWKRYHTSPFSLGYINDYSDGMIGLIKEDASKEVFKISSFPDPILMNNIYRRLFIKSLETGRIDIFQQLFHTAIDQNYHILSKVNFGEFYKISYNIENFRKLDARVKIDHSEIPHEAIIESISTILENVIEQINGPPSESGAAKEIFYEESAPEERFDTDTLSNFDSIVAISSATLGQVINECDILK